MIISKSTKQKTVYKIVIPRIKRSKLVNALSSTILAAMSFLLLWSTKTYAKKITNKIPVIVAQGNDSLKISANTPWVIGKDEPEALQRALEDVKRDWYKIFGHPPIVLSQSPTLK